MRARLAAVMALLALVPLSGLAPAAAASTGTILVYNGNLAFNQGYTLFGTAAGKNISTLNTLPANLLPYDCVVLPMNREPFTAGDIATFSAYLGGGGRIIALAEFSAFPDTVTTMNGLASGVGAGLTAVVANIDPLFHTTTNIDATPYTVGVASIRYAASSEVAVLTSGDAFSLVRSMGPPSPTPATTILGADEIGSGLFVLSGDSNIFSDSSDTGYVSQDNGRLVANLCGGESGGLDVTALSPAHLWIGLRNSDDQGTQFDVKVELYDGSTLIASGLQRCITGVTRDPSRAKEAIVTWDPFSPFTVNRGDSLSFRVSTRVGTTSTDGKCAGPGGSHNSAVGLRLYYDSTGRDSHFDMTLGGPPGTDEYLHSDGFACTSVESASVSNRRFDETAPTQDNDAGAKCKDSGGINFNGGNSYSVIGTWSKTLP